MVDDTAGIVITEMLVFLHWFLGAFFFLGCTAFVITMPREMAKAEAEWGKIRSSVARMAFLSPVWEIVLLYVLAMAAFGKPGIRGMGDEVCK